MRCPFFEEEIVDGLQAAIYCENPDIYEEEKKTGEFRCPYTSEYDCDIPIHVKNIKNLKEAAQK